VCYKEGGLFGLDVDKGYPCRNVFSGWVDFAYDNQTIKIKTTITRKQVLSEVWSRYNMIDLCI